MTVTTGKLDESNKGSHSTDRALEITSHRPTRALDAAGASCAWEWDIASKRLTADAAFAAITLQDPDKLAAGVSTTCFFTSVHPEDLVRLKLAVAAILSGAEIFEREFRLLRDDGGYRWVQATGWSVLDETDKPVTFFGALTDITDQKRVAEQLWIAQSAGGIGTFEYQVGRATVSISHHFCRLFGLHAAKVVPVSTLNALTNAEDAQLIDVSNPDDLLDKPNVEFRITRADNGEERWLARRGEFLLDSETGNRKYVGVVFDITDAKRAQDRLREANEELAGVAKERKQFIAVLGHDLRNPLASLSAGMRILNREAAPAGNRVLKLMGESILRMESMIDNLLDLARGRLGGGIGLEISRGERIEPLLERVVNEIHAAHPERTILTDFSLHTPIDLDRSRFEQMVSNLLGNAITHGAADEPILISASVSEGYFILSVANGGSPIPSEVMERLFQPFYRGDNNPTNQGLGLGLYIAHEIAKAHCGDLSVGSDEMQTKFTFTMPITTA